MSAINDCVILQISTIVQGRILSARKACFLSHNNRIPQQPQKTAAVFYFAGIWVMLQNSCNGGAEVV